MEQSEKDFIKDIYNTHYIALFEYGEDFSEEILISLLAIRHTKITYRCIFNAMCECRKTAEEEAKFNEGLAYIDKI